MMNGMDAVLVVSDLNSEITNNIGYIASISLTISMINK